MRSIIRNRFCRVVAAIFATILILPFCVVVVRAHDLEPISATPASGAILKQSPSQVRLTFSEELSESGSTLQVFDKEGGQVDLGGGLDLDDPQHATLIAELPEMPENVYLVRWKVTLLDGDVSQGEYYFGIGNVTLPQVASDESAQVPSSGGLNPTYLVVGALVVIGLIGFVFLFTLSRRTKPVT